jgi:hypothetical protein
LKCKNPEDIRHSGQKGFRIGLSSFIQTLLSVAESHCICLTARGLYRRSGISPCPEDGKDYYHLAETFKHILAFSKFRQTGFTQTEEVVCAITGFAADNEMIQHFDFHGLSGFDQLFGYADVIG